MIEDPAQTKKVLKFFRKQKNITDSTKYTSSDKSLKEIFMFIPYIIDDTHK